jgi:hypothetical protein
MSMMSKYKNYKIWFPTFLLLIFSAGCCNPGANPDLTPPIAGSVTPLSGATAACPNAPVTATFSVAMNPATINGTTFALTGPGTTPVTGAVTYDAANNTAVFTPSSTLALNTPYTATITTGATDVYGVALASNFVWTFTTNIAPCVAPTVLSELPASGATGVCPSSVVSATFSEAMNPATINTTTFTLTGPGTTPVTGTVSYAGSTAVFTPSSALALNTTYTAEIWTGAQDVFGEALANDFSWSFMTSTAACAAATVTAVSPTADSTGICPNTLVTATFSEAMQSSTINTTTFTLTGGSGNALVTGTVSYDQASNTATFTPASPLELDQPYAANISPGAEDLSGNPLANYNWTFMTSATACQATVPLGSTCSYGGLGGATVTNLGDTIVTGIVGTSPGTAITGFPPGTATAFDAGNAAAATAQDDLTTAYNYAAAAPGGAVLPADIGGVTLTPGVYKTTSAQPSLEITGDLTLSGNGVYIFQIVSTLTTATTNSDVILSGGALPQNVFWQVGSSATLGTGTTFQRIIMAQASVSLGTGAILNGSAMARTGGVTLLDNQVNVPPCPGP